MERVHYSVSGMGSSESKTKIKNALEKIKGVQNVNVDLARGTVEVAYNNPASENEIKESIVHTGYTIL